ncbi:1495_t:CDS:2, partial [Gigaspora rosea]
SVVFGDTTMGGGYKKIRYDGEAGEQRLKQLVNYNYWNVRQDPKLKTKALKENEHIFQHRTTTCKFVADSGEFSE